MEIDDKLKNRLAGAAVITVLAVIFLPMMFDDPVEKKGQVVSEIDIPHKPEVSPLLTTAIVPEKSSEVVNEPKLATTDVNSEATENSADKTDKSEATVDAEKLPVDTESVDIEEEIPVLEKKVAHKKETVTATHFDEVDRATEKQKPHKKETLASSHSNDSEPLIEKKKTHKKETITPESVAAVEEPKPVKHKEPKKIVVAEEEKPVKTTVEKKSAKSELPVLDEKYRNENKTTPTLAKKPLPVLDNRRWVIQVASLSDQAKANAFRDKLRAQGFPATVESAWISGKGRVYRLKVGPELDAQKAHSIQDKINQLHNIKSIAIAE